MNKRFQILENAHLRRCAASKMAGSEYHQNNDIRHSDQPMYL